MQKNFLILFTLPDILFNLSKPRIKQNISYVVAFLLNKSQSKCHNGREIILTNMIFIVFLIRVYSSSVN